MYVRTGEILGEAGYHRYEISNYALPGRECRHNIGYWTHVPYLGFGAAAASFVPAEDVALNDHSETPGAVPEASGEGEVLMLRYQNASSPDYLCRPYVECERLGREDLMREFMILKLRMTEGVSDAEFRSRFGISLFEAFPEEIRKAVSQGLLACHVQANEKAGASGVFLTPSGLDLANLVFEEFI